MLTAGVSSGKQARWQEALFLSLRRNDPVSTLDTLNTQLASLLDAKEGTDAVLHFFGAPAWRHCCRSTLLTTVALQFVRALSWV